LSAEAIIEDGAIIFKAKASERAAIILVPSLGCPGIVDGNKLHIVVLLKQSAKYTPTSEYLADCLRVLSWDQKDNSPDSGDTIQPQDITVHDFTKEFEPFNYVSPIVLDAYRKEGFSDIAYVTCKISGAPRLYNLVTTYDENSVMHRIIEKLPKPYSDCPMIPEKERTKLNGKPLKLYHPFLISRADYLGIAHVTDTHLCCRWYLLDWRANEYNKDVAPFFNNYNTRFVEFLTAIKGDSRINVVLMTGDLIDYNRGHNGVQAKYGSNNDLFKDYLFNRNWLLFYKLLVENYQKPIFTILGNHDYRLNPYAPLPRIFWKELYSISFDLGLLRSEVLKLHEDARDIETGKDGNLYTTYESVAWYSIVINPLVDYTFSYKNMTFAMFDWDKEEDLEDNLPWAENSLTEKQQKILNLWLDRNKGKVKILGMHAPVYNPFPEIGNDYLKDGLIYVSEVDSGRRVVRDGAGNVVVYDRRGESVIYKGTGTMSIKIFKGYTDNRNELVDGTFRENRNELIKRILDNDNYGQNGNYKVGPNPIHIIVTGHAHRNGIYQVIGDRVKLTQRGKDEDWKNHLDLPIFVNTVSAGPLGFDNETGYAEKLDGLKHRYLVRPGYRHILFDSSGKVTSLEKKESTQPPIRAAVTLDFQR
jgi:hypothetical protein